VSRISISVRLMKKSLTKNLENFIKKHQVNAEKLQFPFYRVCMKKYAKTVLDIFFMHTL